MENAAILMFVLLKNRSACGPIMKEMALSEGLTLKHFYHAVFSPSSSHRFISRFLVATWMSGSNEMPGKALLRRMLPSGLVEFASSTNISLWIFALQRFPAYYIWSFPRFWAPVRCGCLLLPLVYAQRAGWIDLWAHGGWGACS